MAGIKSLAKDTAVYGMSSILGRLLNWMLVPMYTRVFANGEYGIVTFDYSAVALMLALLTYGMETGFFRFVNHERWKNPQEVYSTTLISLASTSTLFFVAVCVFLGPLSDFMRTPDRPSCALFLAGAVALDAFTAIPYGYLRYQSRAMRFAVVRLTNIGLNIGLNLFFLLACPVLAEHAPATVEWFYNPAYGIGYIFLSNFIASAANLVLLSPELRGFRWKFNTRLWKEMLKYSWPLLILSFVGLMNQNLPNIIFPYLATQFTAAEADAALGTYGACYKIGLIMVMFLQAFRFAYEPFIFARDKREGSSATQTYSDAMKYFIIVSLFIFLGVMFYLDIIKLFIGRAYYGGLDVVPVIMIAELCFGIVFNLSVWYKLTDKTIWGSYLSLIGFAVMLVMNVVLVPRISFYGCALGALGSYGVMMVVSYAVGQRHYRIQYPLGRIGFYVVLTGALYAAGMYGPGALGLGMWATWGVRAIVLAVYLGVAARVENLRVSRR
ncbi:MAG: oligosaccharide flippase family protein [Muribaculaceae bacterium]|nr:oligosaccharide flippase family protein [Muribaculaceae bacterium]